MVACGAAAAIAASFNTPLAGVVFAMEVIMVEYTIAGFVPVILAAVAATAITRAVFGEETAFLVPLLGLASLWELAYITLMGALIGLISAALLALLEMTGNPYVIMPAMLAVVSANLTAKIVFEQDSIFTLMMRDSGLDYRHDPVSQSLRRVGGAAIMNRSFEHSPRGLTAEEVRRLLTCGPQWILVEDEVERPLLLQASDLARYFDSEPALDVDLVAIPAVRYELTPIHLEANLYEAREVLNAQGADALYVRRPLAPMSFRTFGVVRREDVEAAYEFRA